MNTLDGWLIKSNKTSKDDVMVISDNTPKKEKSVTKRTPKQSGKGRPKRSSIFKSSEIDENDRIKEEKMKQIDEVLNSTEFIQKSVKERALYVLKNVFNHEKFRNKDQEQAITTAIERKYDIYITFPTGAGKSLCYQLPSLCKPGVTIVFSPLIALIQDQISALTEKNIRCCAWNSTLTDKERSENAKDMFSKYPKYRLVYTTPESAQTEFFQRMLKSLYENNMLNYMVVDEAHCISQWGHDFRPKYSMLSMLRKFTIGVPWLALTATASKSVELDIKKSLQFNDCKHFQTSPYRPNLFYDVVSENSLIRAAKLNQTDNEIPSTINGDMITHINKITNDLKNEQGDNFKGCSGIIYCRSRDLCGQYAAFLQAKGILAASYHAKLKKSEKIEIQEKWMKNEVTVICATIAFGMGIDKADVRFVFHIGAPNDLAAYYQESGRAGRDGLKSYCRLYISDDTISTSEHFKQRSLYFIKRDKNCDESVKKIKEENLNYSYKKMTQYYSEEKCRHTMLCSYFGDESMSKCNVNCDICVMESSSKENLKEKRGIKRSSERSLFDQLRETKKKPKLPLFKSASLLRSDLNPETNVVPKTSSFVTGKKIYEKFKCVKKC
uniref:ATP-dependent DNA helicase n=1 Tax=Parastrongyloides trichosuri TaxID=131310 RepID=A0A0N5A1W0_PARTI